MARVEVLDGTQFLRVVGNIDPEAAAEVEQLGKRGD